ncbi:hypothetical protein BGX20_005788, partial [Mortierella sp. AD010]
LSITTPAPSACMAPSPRTVSAPPSTPPSLPKSPLLSKTTLSTLSRSPLPLRTLRSRAVSAIGPPLLSAPTAL